MIAANAAGSGDRREQTALYYFKVWGESGSILFLAISLNTLREEGFRYFGVQLPGRELDARSSWEETAVKSRNKPVQEKAMEKASQEENGTRQDLLPLKLLRLTHKGHHTALPASTKWADLLKGSFYPLLFYFYNIL